MNPLISAFRHVLSGCLVFTMGVSFSTPLVVPNSADLNSTPLQKNFPIMGLENSILPPDINGVPALRMLAPVPVDDGIEVDEGDIATTLVGGYDSVLWNDQDTLTATLLTDPGFGTVSLQPTGTFTYTHDGSHVPYDSFIYNADDGIDIVTSTVFITVSLLNDAPIAYDDSLNVTEGYTATVLVGNETSVLANDTDEELDPLTAELGTLPDYGTVIIDPTGTFTYTHNGSEEPYDSFTYLAGDGDLTASGTVSITVTPVNDAPVAYDDFLVVTEGLMATLLVGDVPSVLTNDTDAENDPLMATLGITPTHGTVLLDPTGTFTYTHNGSEEPYDSFTYLAGDGDLTASGTVSITVTPVNDPPVGVDDSLTVSEGGTENVLDSDHTSVLLNDIDPDNVVLTATTQNAPLHGTLELDPTGTFTYTHDGTENHADSFSYIASDGEYSDTAVVTITITPINDPPIAVDDNYFTNKGVTLEVEAPGVLENDSDAENDPLFVTLETEASNGDLRLYGDGSLDYTPDNFFAGVDDFDYKVCDPEPGSCTIATVTISVTLVNVAPVAMDDHYYTDEGKMLSVPVALGVLANDSDAETDNFSLIASLESDVTRGKLELNNNGSFVYTPPEDYIGIVSFTYKAFDGVLYSNIVTVMVTVGVDNEPPTISWLSPSIDEDDWIDVGTQIYPLEVNPLDNVEIEVVNFRRWEPSAGTKGDWVFLGSIRSSPYRLDLDTSTINIGFNQIAAEAYDTSGNFSDSNIFLRRWESLIYIPVVSYKSD